MFCDKCRLDIQDGQPYTFYYGNQAGKTRRGRQMITTYSFGGAQQTFLCNKCVFTYAMQERAKGFRIGSLFMVGVACIGGIVAFVAPDPNTAEILWFAVALIVAYALSLFLTGAVEKRRAENNDFASLSQTVREDRGSRLAIVLRSASLQAQGYHKFFTPGSMKRLKQSIPVQTR